MLRTPAREEIKSSSAGVAAAGEETEGSDAAAVAAVPSGNGGGGCVDELPAGLLGAVSVKRLTVSILCRQWREVVETQQQRKLLREAVGTHHMRKGRPVK